MFSKMGLGNRLNIIIIAINLLILGLVAFFANSSSVSALRTGAVNRFELKSNNAFQTLDSELSNFSDLANTIATWASEFDAINISSDVNTEIAQILETDPNATNVYSVNILRPEGTIIWISPTGGADNLPQTRLRVISSTETLEIEPFHSAMTSDTPIWFLQESAVHDNTQQATITIAVPYQHETGNGLIWVDMLQARYQELVLNSLNADGLLLETIDGYVIIIDENNNIIDLENMPVESDTIMDNLDLLSQRISFAEKTFGNLYEIEDPFNNDQAGFLNVQSFTATNWRFIALLPESEIPVLPSNVYIPIAIIGLVGIAILILVVNRFIKLSVIRPLVDLGRSATEIGKGNLKFIVFHKDQSDEIGRLARAMDSMRDRLSESYTELQSWSNTLEERVEVRTEELGIARKSAERNSNQLQAAYDESLSVVNATHLQPILDTFIDRILMLLDASYCSIWLLEEDRLHVHLVATNDTRRRISTGVVRMGANQGMVGQAIQLDQLITVDNYEDYNHRAKLEKHFQETELPFSRGMCAALKFAGSAIGAVVVGRPENTQSFDLEAQRQFTLFTNIVSPSVRNAQLFNELQDAVKDAKQANEVKTRFLASVTHELRTPLNLIINNIDFMRVGAFGDVTNEQVSRLNQTVRSAEHLLYLINDLLDVSKIEAGEMQLFIQKQDTNTMIEDAIDNAYALLETYDEKEGKVELKIDLEEDLPEIPMDARRIRQVLNNLLSNGIKFTKEGTVTLKVFQDSIGIHFSVHDTGMGIPEQEMGKLFRAFERTNAAQQQAIEGTGLGLPISRYLVNQHNSDLSVASEIGIGTTFAFTLPFDTSETLLVSMTDTQQITAILSLEDE